MNPLKHRNPSYHSGKNLLTYSYSNAISMSSIEPFIGPYAWAWLIFRSKQLARYHYKQSYITYSMPYRNKIQSLHALSSYRQRSYTHIAWSSSTTEDISSFIMALDVFLWLTWLVYLIMTLCLFSLWQYFLPSFANFMFLFWFKTNWKVIYFEKHDSFWMTLNFV